MTADGILMGSLTSLPADWLTSPSRGPLVQGLAHHVFGHLVFLTLYTPYISLKYLGLLPVY
jgi:hypothetical protein